MRTLLLCLAACAALVLTACDDDPIFLRESNMTFVLEDQCSDGYGLQARLFDLSNDLVWPSNSTVYVVGAGGDIDANIRCRTGALICYGATTEPETSFFWGVGIDGFASCDDCCEPCDDVVVRYSLSC